MDRMKIEQGVRLILEGIGEDLTREGLVDTPQRVVELCAEIFDGLGSDPLEKLKLYSTKNEDELILVRDISFHSICEHHLLPFFGKVHIAYVPAKDRITGFSSLARVVNLFSHRPQLQERLTTDIADALVEALRPRGVLVVIEAEQLCMAMRGIKKPGILTMTSAVRGVFRQEATRMEAFSMIMG
ncbi:MAG: GTP cyclohydrolase I FolE, partial [Candidatus Latescibacterota bacterium]